MSLPAPSPMLRLTFAGVAASCFMFTPLAGQTSPGEREIPIDELVLPEGFAIEVYHDDVPNARQMVLSPGGVLFVGSRALGEVRAVVDADGNMRGDQVFTIAAGLNSPTGLAFRDGSLYVAAVNRILRYDDIEAHLDNPPEPVVVVDDLPDDARHGWKFLAFGPDGKLYVPVGAPCNICEEEDERFATIMRMDPDGSNAEIFARGVRNSVGFDFHPETGELWFTDNGADNLGDDIPPDELNHAPEPGMHFGFPYCHGTATQDADFTGRSCEELTPPAQELGPHVAAIGMRFYTGNMFPEEYHNQILIAEHGSWNRSEPIGYRVSLVRLEGNEAVSYEPFVHGWLQGIAQQAGNRTVGDAFGRPADVLVMPDGSLLVSDDHWGVIYRVTYEGGS